MDAENESGAGYVILTGTIEPEDGGFVSRCPELFIASCGDTVEEALDMLGEAIDCQLEALVELGILETEFRERNIETCENPFGLEQITVTVPPETIVRVYPRRIPVPAPA